jgi:hypothetical protein
MVAFNPPSGSADGTEKWESWFKREVLDKKAEHGALTSYNWEQKKPGWGQLVHSGARDAGNRGATSALEALLKEKGFKKGSNHWGAQRFEPETETPTTEVGTRPTGIAKR